VNFSSRLIYDVARSIESAQLSLEDGRLEIPAVLLPIAEIPISHRQSASAVPTTAEQRASFGTEGSRTRAASAAAVTDPLCEFGKGLWLVKLRFTGLADFTQVITADRQFRCDLADPLGNTISLVRHFAIANIPQIGVFEGRFLFAEDGWALSMTTQATGVAQTTQQMAEVQAFLLA